ncbi:MAG: hypothetical protein WCA61_08880, partial [Nitrososphaeraceae archaeon]
MDKKKARNKYAPNRKIVIYAIIGVVAITAVSAWLVIGDKPTRDLSTSVGPQVEESKQISIDRFQT